MNRTSVMSEVVVDVSEEFIDNRAVSYGLTDSQVMLLKKKFCSKMKPETLQAVRKWHNRQSGRGYSATLQEVYTKFMVSSDAKLGEKIATFYAVWKANGSKPAVAEATNSSVAVAAPSNPTMSLDGNHAPLTADSKEVLSEQSEEEPSSEDLSNEQPFKKFSHEFFEWLFEERGITSEDIRTVIIEKYGKGKTYREIFQSGCTSFRSEQILLSRLTPINRMFRARGSIEFERELEKMFKKWERAGDCPVGVVQPKPDLSIPLRRAQTFVPAKVFPEEFVASLIDRYKIAKKTAQFMRLRFIDGLNNSEIQKRQSFDGSLSNAVGKLYRRFGVKSAQALEDCVVVLYEAWQKEASASTESGMKPLNTPLSSPAQEVENIKAPAVVEESGGRTIEAQQEPEPVLASEAGVVMKNIDMGDDFGPLLVPIPPSERKGVKDLPEEPSVKDDFAEWLQWVPEAMKRRAIRVDDALWKLADNLPAATRELALTSVFSVQDLFVALQLLFEEVERKGCVHN